MSESKVKETKLVTQAIKAYADWLDTFPDQSLFFPSGPEYFSKATAFATTFNRVPAELKPVVLAVTKSMGEAFIAGMAAYTKRLLIPAKREVPV